MVIIFISFSIKYHNIRGLFPHQAKVYCNDINGCYDNGSRVDDNILLRLSEQEIKAQFRIKAAHTHTKKMLEGEKTFVTSYICDIYCAIHKGSFKNSKPQCSFIVSESDVNAVAQDYQWN